MIGPYIASHIALGAVNSAVASDEGKPMVGNDSSSDSTSHSPGSGIDAVLPQLAALRGQEIGTSDWKLIDQVAIDAFSALTGDAGPIHNDPEVAAQVAPFGGTIVQGFFMLSCLTGFAKSLRLPPDGASFRLNYGFDRVRIIAPVPVGSRVRGRFRMKDLVARGEHGALMTTEAVVEIEGSDKPALVADWLAYLQLDQGDPS